VLKPTSLGDIMVYGVFLFALIAAFMLPDGNGMPQNLLYGTIVIAIFDITIGQTWVQDPDIIRAFPAFMARIGLFLLPFIAAGATRIRGKKGRLAPIMCGFAGIIGLLYVLLSFVASDVVAARF
jgi:hypothetical protein